MTRLCTVLIAVCDREARLATILGSLFVQIPRGPSDPAHERSFEAEAWHSRQYHLVSVIAVWSYVIPPDMIRLCTRAMESGTVFNYLSVDFMQSVIPTVDYLLKNNVNVIVISGNLDLIWYGVKYCARV